MMKDGHRHSPQREGVKHSYPKASRPGLHKDWRTWLALGLMLAAMATYVLTLDDSVQPGSTARNDAPVAAAPAK